MHIRQEIETTFDGKVFEHPLFYSYLGGLRFQLSEGRPKIPQFLLALKKATIICNDIFEDAESFILCLRRKSVKNIFSYRELMLKDLKRSDIIITRNRSLWLEPVHEDDRNDENEPETWVTLAFEIPVSKIQNALWLALAADTCVTPKIYCDIYLFNLSKKIAVFPYDDRGMDVVGPNNNILKMLYSRHYQYLLTYDMQIMESTFGTP